MISLELCIHKQHGGLMTMAKKTITEQCEWYFIHNGVQNGPLDDDAVCCAVDNGKLLPTDEMWRTDLEGRFLAGDVKDLFPSEKMSKAAVKEESASTPSVQVGDQPAGNAATTYQVAPAQSGSILCPYCWRRFNAENFLFIVSNRDLLDPILGGDEPLRFLPSRFTPDGHAIDADGFQCSQRACPHCRLYFPESLLTLKPLFLSLIGAPGSGKSYLLASMCWNLRTTLKHFDITFTDTDTAINAWLCEYERRLFVQANRETPQHIDKTQIVNDGKHYQNISIAGMRIMLAMPSMFDLISKGHSPANQGERSRLARTIVMYDNAGEHFLQERDSEQSPGTRHLLHAEALLFLYDPTMDVRFRDILNESKDIQLKLENKVDRQDLYFTETIKRIRQNLRMDPLEQYKKPVVVIVSKADVLGQEILQYLNDNPWYHDKMGGAYSLNYSRLLEVSFIIRAKLCDYAPQVVDAVETFSSDVIYLPVSALGHSPILEESGQLAIRPVDIHPFWVEVPFIYVLSKLGYVSCIMQRNGTHPEPDNCRVMDGMFHFTNPHTGDRVQLPLSYAGISIQCPKTNKWFRIPDYDPKITEQLRSKDGRAKA